MEAHFRKCTNKCTSKIISALPFFIVIYYRFSQNSKAHFQLGKRTSRSALPEVRLKVHFPPSKCTSDWHSLPFLLPYLYLGAVLPLKGGIRGSDGWSSRSEYKSEGNAISLVSRVFSLSAAEQSNNLTVKWNHIAHPSIWVWWCRPESIVLDKAIAGTLPATSYG